MTLDIRHYFGEAKTERWLVEKEEALDRLKEGLQAVGIADTEPFIIIAVSALIRQQQQEKVPPSDAKRSRLAKLKALKKAIDALTLDLRMPLKEMYSMEFSDINPEAVEAYISDESGLAPDELHPPKESGSLNDWIARRALGVFGKMEIEARTYESGIYRQTVELIYEAVGIAASGDHPCRNAIKPPAKEADALAAEQWVDAQIDKYPI